MEFFPKPSSARRFRFTVRSPWVDTWASLPPAQLPEYLGLDSGPGLLGPSGDSGS